MSAQPGRGRKAAVSICVPVWNAEPFLEATLQSALRQSFDDLRVLVAVDQSTDRSLEICRDLAGADERLQVVAQNERLGWVGNTNWLLRNIGKSRYAMILPHDDQIATDYVLKLVGALEANPDAVLAFSDMKSFGEKQSITRCEEIRGDLHQRMVAALLNTIIGKAWRGVFRLDGLDRVPELDASVGPAADQVWLHHLAVAGEFVRVPEALYRKRLHAESVTARAAGNRSDSHWIDHCVACRRIALSASDWTPAEKHVLASAAVARAMSAPVSSAAGFTSVLSDYVERVAGEVRAGSSLPDAHLLPAPISSKVGKRIRALARRTIRNPFKRLLGLVQPRS